MERRSWARRAILRVPGIEGRLKTGKALRRVLPAGLGQVSAFNSAGIIGKAAQAAAGNLAGQAMQGALKMNSQPFTWKTINWKSVAGSAAQAVVSSAVGEGMGKIDYGKGFGAVVGKGFNDLTSNFAGGMANAWAQKMKPNESQIFANAFGTAVGNGLGPTFKEWGDKHGAALGEAVEGLKARVSDWWNAGPKTQTSVYTDTLDVLEIRDHGLPEGMSLAPEEAKELGQGPKIQGAEEYENSQGRAAKTTQQGSVDPGWTDYKDDLSGGVLPKILDKKVIDDHAWYSKSNEVDSRIKILKDAGKQIDIDIMKGKEHETSSNGFFSTEDGELLRIRLNPKGIGLSYKAFLGTLVHELEHAVQFNTQREESKG